MFICPRKGRGIRPALTHMLLHRMRISPASQLPSLNHKARRLRQDAQQLVVRQEVEPTYILCSSLI